MVVEGNLVGTGRKVGNVEGDDFFEGLGVEVTVGVGRLDGADGEEKSGVCLGGEDFVNHGARVGEVAFDDGVDLNGKGFENEKIETADKDVTN